MKNTSLYNQIQFTIIQLRNMIYKLIHIIRIEFYRDFLLLKMNNND